VSADSLTLSQQLAADDFTLFQLPRRFGLDRALLDSRWKDLQREAHPDKFAAQGAAAQRVAMQWSVRINEAYQRLKAPLKRAAYLCELGGVPIQAEVNTAMPAAFLMQQMAWREALDEADHLPALTSLHDDVDRVRREHLALCERQLDQDRDFSQAAATVRALMFIERFACDIEARLDNMDDV
jgi:molecular chaperone HscB